MLPGRWIVSHVETLAGVCRRSRFRAARLGRSAKRLAPFDQLDPVVVQEQYAGALIDLD